MKRIKITGFEGALKLIKRNPWYADRIGEIFTVAFEDKRMGAYIVEEYHGSVIKEDAEVIEE